MQQRRPCSALIRLAVQPASKTETFLCCWKHHALLFFFSVIRY